MTERLWAGWRMAYIRSESGALPPGESCLFCALSRLEPARENLVLERYERTFLMLNAFPYASGHIMVAGYAHTEDLFGESEAMRAEMLAALDRARSALALAYRPDGFNMGANLGRAAGAGVLGHLHWHLVPRWTGDSNFMPAVADTRVLPEALPDSYDRVLHVLTSLPARGLSVTGRGHA
jgi:ATP adenylyltransferase